LKFTNEETIINQWRYLEEIPVSISESGAVSAELKKRGFKFVGTTICYSFMKAAEMVNDHLVSFFRYDDLT